MPQTSQQKFDRLYRKASLHQVNGESAEALRLLTEALELAKQFGSRSETIRVLRRMSETLGGNVSVEDALYARRLATEASYLLGESIPTGSPYLLGAGDLKVISADFLIEEQSEQVLKA